MASCSVIRKTFPLIRPSRYCHSRHLNLQKRLYSNNPASSTIPQQSPETSYKITPTEIHLHGKSFPRDEWTNITEKIMSYTIRKLHLQQYNPLCHIKRQIVDFMYKEFPSRTRSPLFSVFEDLSPAVTVEENFDSILIPKDHVSRSKNDCYYLNKNCLLRAHTSAHQFNLVKSGLNHFLVVGDVYRRDEIDKSHFPVFHQLEAVHLCGLHDVFKDEKVARELQLFERNKCERTPMKQEFHTVDAVMMMTNSLQTTLLKLAHQLFGKDVETRWVETYFPFTHPSWELEVNFNGEWLEVLGCGIMEQSLLQNDYRYQSAFKQWPRESIGKQTGAGEKIGWAFGLGLERLAMRLYQIPDIRLFWSTDSGVTHQFEVDDPYTPIIYKSVSQHPPCINDISFWLPQGSDNKIFSSNDFYDLVRSIGGELVEQVSLVDEFYHKKKQRWSHCYRIVYRHMSKTLTQDEANKIHSLVEQTAIKTLGVDIR